MSDSIEKLISDIVDSIFPDELSLQKQFYLTQSLLALARSAHSAGYRLGCHETTKEFNRLFQSSSAMDGEALAAFVIRMTKMH